MGIFRTFSHIICKHGLNPKIFLVDTDESNLKENQPTFSKSSRDTARKKCNTIKHIRWLQKLTKQNTEPCLLSWVITTFRPTVVWNKYILEPSKKVMKVLTFLDLEWEPQREKICKLHLVLNHLQTPFCSAEPEPSSYSQLVVQLIH